MQVSAHYEIWTIHFYGCRGNGVTESTIAPLSTVDTLAHTLATGLVSNDEH